MGRSPYYTLIGSLPALPRHFDEAERVPVSRVRLDELLKMLDDQDREVIKSLGDFLVWDRQTLDRTDEDVCRQYDLLMAETSNRLVRRIIELVMNQRTVVAALRRRRLGQGPPPGVGPWLKHIEQHWKQPDFGLASRMPWVTQVAELLASDTPLAVERVLLDAGWKVVSRLAMEIDPFSFEAVLLYLLRWELVYRWVRRDEQVGQERFQELVAQSMGSYATLYED
jgi:hypothetical protein